MRPQRLRPWPVWPAVCWLVLLVVLSFLPIGVKQELHTKGRLHDGAHLIAFGILAFLLARTAGSGRGKAVRLLLVALLGLLIESSQDLLYTETWAARWSAIEWSDILVDTLAVGLVALWEFGIRPTLLGNSRTEFGSPRVPTRHRDETPGHSG